MSDATVGRRPDGPGWYWYEGPVIVRTWKGEVERTIDLDHPVEVMGHSELGSAFVEDEGIGEVSFDDMPGDFTPLHKPAAMPQPDWSSAPEWAQWWAVGVERFGPTGYQINAHWHEVQPSRGYGRWIEQTDGAFNPLGRTWPDAIVPLPLGIDWRTTLRKRPEASTVPPRGM